MTEPLLLPALRGIFGDWVFYSCLMRLEDVANRIKFADEIHQSKELSQLIQRQLADNRGKAIAKYLREEKESFFNSLVIAVYRGEPHWLEAKLEATNRLDKDYIDVEPQIGVLKLSGRESLFALDGQHRLSGIKQFMTNQPGNNDVVSLVLVSHRGGKTGLQRTRRLFTTLNKRAKKVSKGEIIALDEDDAAAIIVRLLLQENPKFEGANIVVRATNNILPTDKESLTTIGSLYDIVSLILRNLEGFSRKDLEESPRPSEKIIRRCYARVSDVFNDMAKHFPELRQFYRNPKKAIRRYRNESGGSVLFRPIGLIIVVEVVCKAISRMGYKEAWDEIRKIETNLTEEPYLDVIWNQNRSIVLNKGKSVARDMVLVSLELQGSEKKKREILARYQKAMS